MLLLLRWLASAAVTLAGRYSDTLSQAEWVNMPIAGSGNQ